MWLILFLTLTAAGTWLAAWLALACCGLAVLAAIAERLQARTVDTTRTINQVLTAQVRHYEQDRP
jgi:hypothetical protein